MYYRFGTNEEWQLKPVSRSPVHALKEATGPMLYVYDDSQDLIFAKDFTSYLVGFIKDHATEKFAYFRYQYHKDDLEHAPFLTLRSIAKELRTRADFSGWLLFEIENLIRNHKGIPLYVGGKK